MKDFSTIGYFPAKHFGKNIHYMQRQAANGSAAMLKEGGRYWFKMDMKPASLKIDTVKPVRADAGINTIDISFKDGAFEAMKTELYSLRHILDVIRTRQDLLLKLLGVDASHSCECCSDNVVRTSPEERDARHARQIQKEMKRLEMKRLASKAQVKPVGNR